MIFFFARLPRIGHDALVRGAPSRPRRTDYVAFVCDCERLLNSVSLSLSLSFSLSLSLSSLSSLSLSFSVSLYIFLSLSFSIPLFLIHEHSVLPWIDGLEVSQWVLLLQGWLAEGAR